MNPTNRKPHLYSRTRWPRPTKKKILRLLEADESTHIDQMVELLENEMSSSEIFAALL
jgi:hypothetical protein